MDTAQKAPLLCLLFRRSLAEGNPQQANPSNSPLRRNRLQTGRNQIYSSRTGQTFLHEKIEWNVLIERTIDVQQDLIIIGVLKPYFEDLRFIKDHF